MAAVTSVTDRCYRLLPEHFRTHDERAGWPLYSYLSGPVDQAQPALVLVDRLARGELADVDLADDDWLPWLAQHLGVRTDQLGSGASNLYAQFALDFGAYQDVSTAYPTYTAAAQHGATVPGGGWGPVELRDAIATKRGWRAGSRRSYRDLVRTLIVGTKQVLFTTHHLADPWHLLIETYARETPRAQAVAAALARYDHPAGLQVTYQTRSRVPYQTVADHYGTYADVDAGFSTYESLADWIPPEEP